ACWHGDDIVLAFTWFGGKEPADDDLYAATSGLGIGKGAMADFDDVAHVANVGLAHSILWLEQKRARAAARVRGPRGSRRCAGRGGSPRGGAPATDSAGPAGNSCGAATSTLRALVCLPPACRNRP